MKKILAVFIVCLVLLLGFSVLPGALSLSPPNLPAAVAPVPRYVVIAQNLDTPWGIAFLSDRDMLVTERSGNVRLINTSGNSQPELVATITGVREAGEGGLLGITVDPDFAHNNLVYLYYTFRETGNGNTLNRVIRMTYRNRSLTDAKVLVDGIPGSANHNGGRIKFGPDGFLYITTGDAQNPSQAQDIQSLGGKILRVTGDGQPAPGNPFGNLVYSYGHRNPQGLAWDKDGRLWATEHGRSGVQSGLDEINLIESGKNYGWPEIQGSETQNGMVSPRIQSGSATWAPAGAAFLGDSLYFGGLRGQTLYEVVLNNGSPVLREHYKGQFGRIRDVVLGPRNRIFLTTSNRDGRGNPVASDDRIIEIIP